MRFHDLDEDILHSVFAASDVHTVLSMARVNKLCRNISNSRPLWLALVAALVARRLMDEIPPEILAKYSTADLIKEVRRLVSGPESWFPRSPAPILSRQIIVEHSSWAAGQGDIVLLPGAEYALISTCQGVELQCWSVATKEHLWTRATRLMDYAVHMLDSRSALFLFLPYTNRIRLQITRVDLRNGLSEDLFHLPLDIHLGFVKNPVVFGDLFAVSLRLTDESTLLLVDWREGKYIIFHCSKAWPRPGMAFVPGHVILTTASAEPPHDQLLVVYTLLSLTSRWRPIAEIDLSNQMRTTDVQPTVLERMDYKNFVWQDAQRVRMTLHSNPLRSNGYKLILYLSPSHRQQAPKSISDMLRQAIGRAPPQPAQSAMVFTHHFTISSSPTSDLRRSRTSVRHAVPDLFFPDVSYCGYTVNIDSCVLDIYAPLKGSSNDPRHARERFTPNIPRLIAVTDPGCHSAHLSPSGAVTTLGPESFTVSYYI
ncbi:hypothetical protein C8J57DRAFT_1318890, partial [Mycena rebaudengoi]